MKIYDLEELGQNEISFYLALEEYLLQKESDDVFFIWRIDKSIIIGRNQLLETECNISFSESIGCRFYRRLSGGGAIYADSGCFMFSFLTKMRNKDEIYKKFLTIIKDKLYDLGLEVKFSGRNDLLFQDKKFSGNAFYQNKDGSVLHGTFLYDSNLEYLVKCLTPSNEKLISKGIKSVSERVINLKKYLKMSQNEVIFALSDQKNAQKTVLREDEILKVRLLQNKFSDKSWIFEKKPPYTFHNKVRYSYGELEVFIDVKNGFVKRIDLFGDFFIINDLKNYLSCFNNTDFSLESFITVLKDNELDLSNYIDNSNNDDFLKLIFGG